MDERGVLAELRQIVDDAAGDELQRDLLELLARVHVLVARAWDEPDTPETRAQLQAIHDELEHLAGVLDPDGEHHPEATA
jgi:hypothetical protein